MTLPSQTRTPGAGAASEREVDWTKDAVVAVDNLGIVRLSNREADDLFGYSSDEMAGRPVDTLIRGRVKRRSSCAAGLRKDQTEFQLAISLCSVATEEGLLMLAVLRDTAPQGDRRAHRRSSSRDACDFAISALRGPPHDRPEDGLTALDPTHRFSNALAGIANYASLATESLEREILRRHLGSGAFSGVLADVARIGDAAKDAGGLVGTAHPAQRVERATDRASRPLTHGRTVLVVDDDAAVRDSAGRLLQREGYAVIEAGGPEAALAMSAAHPGRIDLLLTDYAMPGGGGRDLRAALGVGRPETKVLFMTGYGPAYVRQGGLDARDNIIHKPFSAGDLYRKVAEVLTSGP